MAVLPGATSNRPTPGGMPDSRQMGKVGPTPSMPKMGAGPAEMGSVAGVPNPDDLVDLFTAYTSGQMSRDDLIGQLHTFSEGQGGILGLLEGMDQGDTGSRTAMADQAVDVVDNQGGAARTTQPVMPGGVMPGVGLEVGGAGPQGGQGALGQSAGLGAIPALTEPLDQRHQRISLLLQGHGLQPDDADQMSTLLNPHIKGHTTRWSEEEQLHENVWADYVPSTQRYEQDIAYDPTINVIPGGDTSTRVGTEAPEMRVRAGLGGTTGSQGVGVVRGELVGDLSLLEGADSDLNKQIFEAAKSYVPGQYVPGGDTGVTTWSRDWEESPEFGISRGQSGYVAPEEIHGDEAWSTPSKPELMVGGGLDVARQKTPGLRTGVESSVIPLGSKNAAGDTWDGTKWVKAEAVIDPSAVDVGATYTDAAGNEQLVSEAVLHPFFEGWKPADQTMVPGGPAPGTQYVTSPEFPGVVFPSEKLMNDFFTLRGAAGEVYTHHTDSGKRFRDFVGWSEGYGSTPQFENVVAVQKGGKMYYFTNNVDAQFFDTYGGFPKGDWADGWGPGSGKPMPPGFEVSKDAKGGVTWVKPPSDKPFITGDALPKGAIEGPMGDITWNGVYIGYRDSSTGSIVWDEAFLASQEESAGGYTDVEGGTYEYDVSGGVTGLGGDGAAGGAGGAGSGGTDVYTSEDFLYGKQLFDAQSVDSNRYPGLSQLVQSLTEGGERSESLTATIINAVRDMETMKRQEGENQFQRMMQTSIAQLDRKAVTDRAQLDRDLAIGVATGKIGEDATLAAESEKNAQLMREYQLSGMMPTEWQAAAGDAGVPTLEREAMGVRQQEAATAALSVEQRREQDLSALFGQYISPDRQPAATAQTLDAQKWGWTKTMQEAELSGMVWSDVAGTTETMSMKRLTFEKDIAAQKNSWETQRISNEETSIRNQYNINQQSIASTQMIEQNKLSEAVAARKAKNQLEREKVQIDKNKLKIETLLSLAEPATFLFATRFGLLDNLGIALGVDFSDEMYPGELPSMLEPGTIPTMQQLRAATPAERQIMLAEMAATGGYSVEEALSRVQSGVPGGRRIQRESLAGVGR